MATELTNKKAERDALRGLIQQWNANRLDLFELSEPNEDLEFHGVMRFYFQDSGQKVATKCIRVASDATSQAVIETLIEKFRPDMRMLSVPEYALYEIHENGEERKLDLEEKPLLVQLNWHMDDREGRFLLKRIDDKTNAQGVGFTSAEGSSFRRKLSKREKKQIKKQEKLSRLKSLEQDENAMPGDQNGVAEKLYTELPETSFTRSISNPEAVMRRRRQQKLERRLQQFRSKDGGPDTGGTLKIYGEALCKDVPYKTLLLSVRDSAAQVVREMLSKYGLEKVDPQLYCLVQVNSENVSANMHQEYILDDDECPLAILMNHPSTRGSIMFHVRRRPADYMPRKRKKKPAGKWNELDHKYEDERLPFLLELNPDGSDIPNGAGVRHRLQPNVTEVGSERPIGPQAVQAQTLTLPGPMVMPRHCVIAFTENIVTLTPCSRDAHTYVNNQRIHQTTILQVGSFVFAIRMIRTPVYSYFAFVYRIYRVRSPDATSQDVSSEKFHPGSGAPNGGGQIPGQAQERATPSSPSKSAVAAVRSPRSPTHPPEPTHNYETTFDLDGNVETASLSSSRDGNSRLSQYDRQPRGTDPILPAVLEFLEETEETFLHAVITDIEPSAPQFKLAPTYTLYLSARYRASTHYRPELQPTERAHRLTVMLANVATMIQRVIQERYMDASSLAFWLANGSELLHMLKSDRHVGAFSTRAQDILAEAVHTAFGSLVRCITLELTPAMTQFMADADEPAKEAGVLQIFSNTMALLRRCRVNAALTIQLFSHLFHAINATAFNTLVSNGNLCVRWFGRRLKARLNALETWAERQGLELASQCHLATIMQATHLLQAPKYNAEELATLSSTCFKLNSLQVRALLQKYQPAADEPRLPAELIENVVRVAESVADTLARADGREIRLEEEPVLGLALLLPEDGYSCEVIRGVPPGLAEFLAPLQRDGLCRMAAQPTSSGYWTIYMIDHHNNLRSPSAMSNRSGGYISHINQNQAQPEIHVIKLHKSTNGMGLSIVAAKGAGQDRLGIYIKSVVAGGAADADGRLTAGDQLLKVDGQSLVGITQEKAAEYLVRTGPIVTLEVAKQGAIYHGLATLLSQPSPVMSRAYKTRPRSELLESAVETTETTNQPATSHSVGDLLSFPKQAPCQEPVQPGVTKNYKHSLLTEPLTVDRNLFDNIPYIDQTDGINFTESSECVQTNLSNKCEHCINADCDNFNLENSQKRTNEERNRQQTSFELNTRNNPNFSLISSFPVNNSILFTKDTTIGSDSVVESKSDDFLRFYDVDTTKHVLNIDERCEDKLEDMSNSEDCADESSSTINDDCASSRTDRDTEEGISTPKMYTIMPELHLDLSGLNNDMSSDESKMEKCWKSPEEVRLGCGRVAALAKHFSKLGDAGLIKFKSTKLNGSRQFVSEPNIMTSHKSDEHLHHSYHAQKEYKSDSNLVRERDENSRLCLDGRHNNIILVDVEADDDFAIEKCKFHHCGTRRVTIAKIPMNEQITIDTEENKIQARGENHDKNIIKDENQTVFIGGSKKNMLTGKDNIKNSSSKLSFEQQRVIAEQLEQFSNLDNADAPLFIPEQDMSKNSTISQKNQNNETSAIDYLTQLNLIKQLETAPREKLLSLIDIDDNFKKIKKTSDSSSFSSLPSIPSPSSSIVMSLSNVAKSSQPSENIKSQIYQYCERYPKCLFIDISAAKNCSNDTSKSSLMSHTNVYSQLGDNKCSVLRMRIARPLCNSESNLIGAAIYDKETERAINLHDKSSKLTQSCESILNNKFLSDSNDRTRSFENICKELDSSCKFYDTLISNPKGSVRWHHHHSLEELKSKKGLKKRDNSMNSISVHSTQTKFDKFYGDRRLDFEDEEDIHWNRHLSLEELKSKRESHEQDKCMNLERSADVQRFNWMLKKRLCMKRISDDRLKDNSLKLSHEKAKDMEQQTLKIEGKSQSKFDVSRRKSDSERYNWSFREISSLKDDDRSALRPRRMSERDLPSRLGHDATLQQIHSSKSVPALHNMGTEAKQQHEVFNPGYSRASSSNSVTPPVQPPPMATINSATSLRSRSSHNLHDPMRIGTLPSTGLVSRQQSSPNLNPSTSHMNTPSNVQGTEAERFYQNLSIYRNQDSTMKQQISPQQSEDSRNPQHIQKGSLKGSQNSLNRPSTMEVGSHFRDRPTSAYITQGQQQSYSAVSNQMQQQTGGPPPRSQSSRDIIRQEAKMQEMQEEVRRRELRGGVPLLNQHRPPMYNISTRMAVPPAQVSNLRLPRPLGSTSNLPGTSNYMARQNAPSYNYLDAQYAQYNSTQYGQYNQYPNRYPVIGSQYGPMMMPKPKNETIARDYQPMPNENLLGRDSSSQEAKSYAEQNRHFASSQNNPHYPNGNLEHRVDQYENDNVNRAQNGDGHSTEVPPTRPALPSEDTFSESPPPPPPSTSTHPLYKQADTRYTASMQDPPRGSYYPVGGISAMQQPRQYQYSATNPWQREEREKEQARRREAARQWRDQQIAELSALTHRTQQQEEQLRALQLERDFQKRAEEIANQDDDEESNDLDNESVQRVQGLLRMAANQDRAVQGALQPPTLSRTITGNQSMRGGLPLLSSQSVTSHVHILPNQTAPQNVEMSSPGQENNSLHVQPNQQQQQTAGQNEEHVSPTNYGTHSHFSSGQKSYSMGMSHSEDRELQRKMDEVKRKQAGHEENPKKQEEQQTYQSNQHPRSQLHPGMLRLDNLIINGPNISTSSQNNVNDAPPPPERGSSYAVMSQQSALRSNGSTTSNLPPTSQQSASMKRVSFHDSNANNESMLRNVSSGMSNPPSISMDTIREDPNKSSPASRLYLCGLQKKSNEFGCQRPSKPFRADSQQPIQSHTSLPASDMLSTTNGRTGNIQSFSKKISPLTKKKEKNKSSPASSSKKDQTKTDKDRICSYCKTKDHSNNVFGPTEFSSTWNFINDAENLLASPKTPEGSGTSFTGATPGVIGAQEVYKDPRQKRLAEKQKQQQNSQIGAVPEKLSFKEKMKMFAMETGEDGTPRDKVKISRAQREIDNISSPLNSNNNNNNNNTTTSGNNTNNNRT
ncbi:AFAD protein, partial [Acromyrmex insinuator]